MHKKIVFAIYITILYICVGGCKESGYTQEKPGITAGLVCKHIDEALFSYAIREARTYTLDDSDIFAGVVPHHTTGATLISGFFAAVVKQAEKNESSGFIPYDTVLIVAPNHKGDLGDVIVSRSGWDVGSGVACDKDIIDKILQIQIDNMTIVENDKRMEEDHSAATMIPFIYHYLPDTKIAPVLVSRTLNYENAMLFAQEIGKIIQESGKRVLMVASIDFSHYLTPTEAEKHDEETVEAVLNFDYRTIHGFSNANIDSPASMIVFLRYLEINGCVPKILDNTDASKIIQSVTETTSYFVFCNAYNNIPTATATLKED